MFETGTSFCDEQRTKWLREDNIKYRSILDVTFLRYTTSVTLHRPKRSFHHSNARTCERMNLIELQGRCQTNKWESPCSDELKNIWVVTQNLKNGIKIIEFLWIRKTKKRLFWFFSLLYFTLLYSGERCLLLEIWKNNDLKFFLAPLFINFLKVMQSKVK